MPRNALNRGQARALEDFLMARRGVLGNRSVTIGEVVAEASEAIGCDVSIANVKGAVRAIGITAAFKRESGPVKRKPHPGKGNVLMIAKALADIIDKLGETVPPELTAYITSKEGK